MFPCAGLNAMGDPLFGWLHWKAVLFMGAAELGCLGTPVDRSGEGGLLFSGEGVRVSVRLTVVMSWMLALLLSFPPESCLIKYF